jgi:chitin disaccharide deacetylase
LSAPEKLLIVNADDFGFTRDVNEGIVEAHRNGILTATTLMANAAAFDHAVTLARRHPSLDIGCHLVLIGGHSLLGDESPYPRDVPALLAAIARGKLDVEAELDAQIRRILSTGLRPTHLDTHKHTHLLPKVLHAVGKLSHQYRIPWVRRPFDYPMHAGAVPFTRRVLTRSLGFCRNWFHRVLASYGCRTTDHFAGFAVTGFYETPELVQLLSQLPPGSTEFMTHPGFCTGELRQARTRLKETRQKELTALTARETREAVERASIRIVSYRDL